MRGYPHLASLKMFFFFFQTTNIFYSSLLFTNHLLKKIFLIIEIWNTNITKLRWILLSDQDLTLVPRLDNTPRQIDSMWVMRVKRDVQGWLKLGGLQFTLKILRASHSLIYLALIKQNYVFLGGWVEERVIFLKSFRSFK